MPLNVQSTSVGGTASVIVRSVPEHMHSFHLRSSINFLRQISSRFRRQMLASAD